MKKELEMRKVCIVTGSRAEYDLLFFLMKEVRDHSFLELQVMVTGSHLIGGSEATIQKIRDDGFTVSSTVDMLLASNTPSSVAKSLGVGVLGITAELERLNPDLVVILGDRFEALAAAQSAMIQRIPIAHIHGGEATEGTIDEAIRHSITKMSQIHFVAAEEYSERVVQLGENPKTVHLVGAMGLDNISRLKKVSKNSLELDLGISLSSPTFLVTYHPVTLKESSVESVKSLFLAFDQFPQANIVFTGTNLDPGGIEIDKLIQKYVAKNKDRMVYRNSLGAAKYLSLMSHASVVIGNSSSGLLEAPSIGVPSINIGPRQQGRLKAPSVINCDEEKIALIKAIKQSLDSDFQNLASKRKTPYGNPGAAKKVASVISDLDLENVLIKNFYKI